MNYGVIKSIENGQVTIAVDEQLHTFSINKDDESAISTVVEEGMHIVAVDLENQKILFDIPAEEEGMPSLEGAEYE